MGAFDQDELIGICGFVPFSLDDMMALPRAGTIIQMYVRSAYSGRRIGLKLAKAVVDEAPKMVKEGVSKEEAEEIKAKLTEVGATIEIQ